MNEVYHRKYVLEFDVWEPFRKVTDEELDKLRFDLKNKLLIPHAAQIRLSLETDERISPPEAR